MSEIYRDETTKAVTLGVGSATVTSVKFVRDGVDIVAPPPINGSVLLPYSITHSDGDFDTVWNYTVEGAPYTRTDRNTVVTPYFTAADLTDDPDLSAMSAGNIIRLEAMARRAINKYTGQPFGLREGTTIAYGTGAGTLKTRERVNSLLSVAYASYPTEVLSETFRPINGGYGLAVTGYASDSLTIKVPAYEEEMYNGIIMGRTFGLGVGYLIVGTFGFPSVPNDVKISAIMLAKMLSADESVWKDHYVKSISAADWTLDFDSNVFRGTGHSGVDSLLARYCISWISVI